MRPGISAVSRRLAAVLGGKRKYRGPVSDSWGLDRGTPIDRYYIADFLARHATDIRGRCLEVRDTAYTDRFGQDVRERDVVDIDSDNPRATFVTDLARADDIPSNSFHCFILTQTLQFVSDPRAAADHVFRILAPGGVLLLTVPCISKIGRGERPRDRWRFTELGCRTLLEPTFGSRAVVTGGYGNVVSAMAFLDGLAAEDLSRQQLDSVDDAYPVIVTVRAVKSLRT